MTIRISSVIPPSVPPSRTNQNKKNTYNNTPELKSKNSNTDNYSYNNQIKK